jgi:hypothetical protein
MDSIPTADRTTQAPTPATVQAVIARFTAGMREPGRVTIALLAAHFGCSWAEAERLLASVSAHRDQR